VGLPSRLRESGLDQDALDYAAVQAELTPRSRGILLDSGKAKKGEPPPPKTHGVGTGAEFGGDLLVLRSLGGPEDDLGSQHQAVGSGTTPGPALEFGPFLGCQDDGGSDAHTAP